MFKSFTNEFYDWLGRCHEVEGAYFEYHSNYFAQIKLPLFDYLLNSLKNIFSPRTIERLIFANYKFYMMPISIEQDEEDIKYLTKREVSGDKSGLVVF